MVTALFLPSLECSCPPIISWPNPLRNPSTGVTYLLCWQASLACSTIEFRVCITSHSGIVITALWLWWHTGDILHIWVLLIGLDWFHHILDSLVPSHSWFCWAMCCARWKFTECWITDKTRVPALLPDIVLSKRCETHANCSCSGAALCWSCSSTSLPVPFNVCSKLIRKAEPLSWSHGRQLRSWAVALCDTVSLGPARRGQSHQNKDKIVKVFFWFFKINWN